MLTVMPVAALKDNYIWLIIPDQSQQCLIVDPGEAKPVISAIKQHRLQPSAILITHHHWDHTNGIADLVTEFSIPVYGPAQDNIALLDYALQGGQSFTPNNFPATFMAYAIPGHTLGHMAYYGHGLLFSGDTLFTAGCGRIFEGNVQQMYRSLTELATLPEHTLLYCGHEYTLNNLKFAATVEPNNLAITKRLQETIILREQGLPTVPSTLLLEKATNPFLRCHQTEVINTVNQYKKAHISDLMEIFAALREWKNNF